MRYIEFIMRDRSLNFTISEDRARKVLESNDQMILLNNDNGEWTGQTINKAEIIGTKVDIEKTRDEREKELAKSALESGDSSDELHKKRVELIEKYKPDFLKKK